MVRDFNNVAGKSYVPPRLRELGQVHLLTQTLKLIGKSDGVLFHGNVTRTS